jgi:hypothetical protein
MECHVQILVRARPAGILYSSQHASESSTLVVISTQRFRCILFRRAEHRLKYVRLHAKFTVCQIAVCACWLVTSWVWRLSIGNCKSTIQLNLRLKIWMNLNLFCPENDSYCNAEWVWPVDRYQDQHARHAQWLRMSSVVSVRRCSIKREWFRIIK